MKSHRNKTALWHISSETSKQASNAKLAHQSKLEALSTLIKISTALGFMATDLRESLQFLVNETKRLYCAHGCAIFSFDDSMSIEGVFSNPPDLAHTLKTKFQSVHNCFVVRDEFPYIIQEARTRANRCKCFSFNKAVRSYACLPISTGKRLVGVLLVSSKNPHDFPPDRLEMMLSVASMAASVIQRAQLFGKLEKEKNELENANKEISKLNSALKAKMEELRRAQDQIIQTEKLAVAGRLAAGVSHELNNPIGIIINRIECILSEAREMGVSDGLKRDLETIGRYAHKISMIVRDLSVFSRTTYSKPHFKQTDINDVLSDVFFLMDQKIDAKAVRFIKELFPEPLLVNGDPAKLEQVFINIIDNAIDAITDKGCIRVSTRGEGGFVRIEISDSGIGIPKEHLNKIYDPFFTTKEIGRGTGLGLPISHAIIREHGGSIEVESSVNKGSRFTITLPRHQGFRSAAYECGKVE